MLLARTLAAFALVTLLAACGPGGRGSFNPQPTGNITELLVGANTIVPVTSLSSPLQVHNGFSLFVSETNYGQGTYTATILSYTAATAGYTVAMDGPGTTAIFTPTLPFTAGNVESVQIEDVRNNKSVVFFQNVGP